jgi:8-hydroxy-5-deazaflavin:NADPH oxidoreductase
LAPAARSFSARRCRRCPQRRKPNCGSESSARVTSAARSARYGSKRAIRYCSPRLVGGLGELAQAGTVDQAIAFGDVLFIAVPYGALPQIGQDYGAALKGKIMLDACNVVVARDGSITDEVEREGVRVISQKHLQGTRLVHAFNMRSYKIFCSEANRPDPKLAVPIASDDPEAVRVAAALVRDAGFDPIVVGKLADASRFQRSAPGYGQALSAAELKQKLSLAP